MGYSKRQFVEGALAEIGLASYAFDLQPQQMEAALRRLDAMMTDWEGKGIRLSYPVPSSPGASNIDTVTEVPDYANEAIITNLAVRIAPSYGKQVMPATMTNARNAYETVLQNTAMPMEMQLPNTMPLGQGNKPWVFTGREYVIQPRDPLLAGGDGPIDV